LSGTGCQPYVCRGGREQGRGSRLFRWVMWKSDGFRWIWGALGGGISRSHVSKEEKGRDGCNGSAGWEALNCLRDCVM